MSRSHLSNSKAAHLYVSMSAYHLHLRLYVHPFTSPSSFIIFISNHHYIPVNISTTAEGNKTLFADKRGSLTVYSSDVGDLVTWRLTICFEGRLFLLTRRRKGETRNTIIASVWVILRNVVLRGRHSSMNCISPCMSQLDNGFELHPAATRPPRPSRALQVPGSVLRMAPDAGWKCLSLWTLTRHLWGDLLLVFLKHSV